MKDENHYLFFIEQGFVPHHRRKNETRTDEKQFCLDFKMKILYRCDHCYRP